MPGHLRGPATKGGSDVEYVITREIEERIREGLDERGRLPCPVAWALAREFELPVLAIGRWADDNGVRICSCALGCFQ